MLTTILSIPILILKIIGIILLVVLGLIILILLILMIPVRYSFEMEKEEGGPLKAGGSAKWFAGIFRSSMSYRDNELIYWARFMGIPFLGNDPETLEQMKERERKKREKAEKKQKMPEPEEGEKEGIPGASPPREQTPVPEEVQIREDREAGPAVKDPPEYSPRRTPAFKDGEPVREDTEKESQQQGEEDKKKERISLLDRIEALFDKIEGLGDRLETLGDRIEALLDKIRKAIDAFEEYQVPKLAVIFRDTLIRIIRHVFPRSIRGWVRYGFDDPSLTGYAAGAASLFYPRYYKEFSLEPDFHETCLAGECQGNGRIRPAYFIWLLITLLMKKEARKLLRLILK